jgi:hypothetical protein
MKNNIEYYKKKIEEARGFLMEFNMAINSANKEASEIGYLMFVLPLKMYKVITEMYLMLLEERLEKLTKEKS